MANVQLQIDAVAGKAKLTRLLQAVAPDTVLTAVGGRLLFHVDESFRTRGRGTWRALSPITLALRRFGGNVPLQDTGRYKESFVTETDHRTYVEVGTNLKISGGLSLAKIHEFGTDPYTIRVRRASVLAAELHTDVGGVTWTKYGGRWIFFGKEVHHPGIPARPVLPTKAVAERLVLETIDAMLARIAQPTESRFGG